MCCFLMLGWQVQLFAGTEFIGVTQRTVECATGVTCGGGPDGEPAVIKAS